MQLFMSRTSWNPDATEEAQQQQALWDPISSPWGCTAKINRPIQQEMKTMKTDGDGQHISLCVPCICACLRACLFTYVRQWYLWESVLSLGPDLHWQMHLPGGTVGMCVCVEGVGCNRGNCKQWLVLSSSSFPPSQSTFRRLLRASACVCLCLSPPWVMSRTRLFNNIACTGGAMTWVVTTVRSY